MNRPFDVPDLIHDAGRAFLLRGPACTKSGGDSGFVIIVGGRATGCAKYRLALRVAPVELERNVVRLGNILCISDGMRSADSYFKVILLQKLTPSDRPC